MEKKISDKDKLEDSKKKIIEMIAEQQRIRENSKYGEFIIQANEILYGLMKGKIQNIVWKLSIPPILRKD